MGLKNAVAYFQRIMNAEIRRKGLQDFVDCFLDDILIFSNSVDEHIQHIKRVLDMFKEGDNMSMELHKEHMSIGIMNMGIRTGQ